MSNYPSDFQAGPSAYAPVEPTVFMGVEPLMLGLVALLALILLFLGWWVGHAMGSRETDAAESIWTDINQDCAEAMRVNSDALPEKAKALQKTINDRLGPVLVLVNDMNKSLKLLNEAIKGRTTAPPGNAGGSSTPHLTVLNNSHVVIRNSGGEQAGTGSTPGGSTATQPAAPPVPPERDMTIEERADALRRAVALFNDHWCQKPQRLSDLRRARHALSRVTVRRPHSTGGAPH